MLINGFEVRACFREETVSGILVPLLERLTSLQKSRNGRLVAFLAAPPACGKSTLAAFLEKLSRELPGLEPVQALGIDGFHYHRDHVLSHTVSRDGVEVPMKDVKGCPESYDVEKLAAAVQALRSRDIRWPWYDRTIHDAVEDAIEVTGKIVLIEGNWLLLWEGAWSGLKDSCDCSIWMQAEAGMLRDRLIGRKMRGGLSRAEAERFYERSDGPNIVRCQENSAEADLTLRLGAD